MTSRWNVGGSTYRGFPGPSVNARSQAGRFLYPDHCFLWRVMWTIALIC